MNETAAQVLACPMNPEDNDAEASTVREYLIALLRTLWREQEGFSSKRPFGNSSWDWDLARALVQAGLVEGGLDEDGYLDWANSGAVDRMIGEAIEALK